MKTLVTGGGGFLGRYLVEQLLARGDEVRVLARGDYPQLTTCGAEVVRGDLRDTVAVRLACRDIETVYHAAAVPGVWGSREFYFSTNVVGTRNILNACCDAGVARLIYTSSPSVVFDGSDHVDGDESLPYPDRWLCHYPWSKAIAEQEVLAAHRSDGLRTVSLRPHLIWGPRDNHLIPQLLQRASRGQLRRVGDGSNVVSVSYVENAAAAHLSADAALRRQANVGGREYFINEPEAVNLWDWIDEILQRAGMSPVSGRISAPAAFRVGAVLETVWRVLRLRGEPRMTRFVALQLSRSHSYSIAAASRDLGYRPAISIAEGMQRMQADLDRWGARD